MWLAPEIDSNLLVLDLHQFFLISNMLEFPFPVREKDPWSVNCEHYYRSKPSKDSVLIHQRSYALKETYKYYIHQEGKRPE
jgi:hypothetical protein